MEVKLIFTTLLLLVPCAFQYGALAQTTHIVGDSLGWTIPPGGEIAYQTWAATKTFVVGDVLVFDFTANIHDVAEVSKSSYDSCNSTAPISLSTDSPTNITLTSAGEHHFICTFSAHCGLGQKLAINVSAAPSMAPAPQMAGGPTPAPASGGVARTYVVGDGIGWTVPPGGPVAYRTWARGKRFMVGDILVFNFTSGAHDVIQVTRSEFDSCNITTTTTSPIMTTPARITLTSPGEHYYICTFPQHCTFGQKLAINVLRGSTSTEAPLSSPAPGTVSGGPTSSRPTTPSVNSPPTTPGNSASTFGVVGAFPLTFLAVIVVAFLYN